MERFRLFVSCPEAEFREERRMLEEKVRGNPVLRRCFTVSLVERPCAADSALSPARRDALDECDVFVALFGATYGGGAGSVSPTEEEFDRATAGRKKRLLFVKRGDDAQRDPRMTALIRKAEQSAVRTDFTDSDSLRAAVLESLVTYLLDYGILRTERFDEAGCPRASLADLGEEPVGAFLRCAREPVRRRLGHDPGVAEVLRYLDLGDDERLTNAAVLLFGARPTKFHPSAVIKCVQFDGLNPASPIAATSFVEGPIFGAIERATEFVLSRLPSRTGLRTDGPRAPGGPRLPEAVVTEAIVNAVAHRDYFSAASVQVMLFSDRLEIINPGKLPTSLTVSALSEPHPSVPRNRAIVRALRQTRYMETKGTGTLRMIDGCRQAGLPAPEFRRDSGAWVHLAIGSRDGMRRPAPRPSSDDASVSK